MSRKTLLVCCSLLTGFIDPRDVPVSEVMAPPVWLALSGEAFAPAAVAVLQQTLDTLPVTRPLPTEGLRIGLLAPTPDAQGQVAWREILPPLSTEALHHRAAVTRYRQWSGVWQGSQRLLGPTLLPAPTLNGHDFHLRITGITDGPTAIWRSATDQLPLTSTGDIGALALYGLAGWPDLNLAIPSYRSGVFTVLWRWDEPATHLTGRTHRAQAFASLSAVPASSQPPMVAPAPLLTELPTLAREGEQPPVSADHPLGCGHAAVWPVTASDLVDPGWSAQLTRWRDESLAAGWRWQQQERVAAQDPRWWTVAWRPIPGQAATESVIRLATVDRWPRADPTGDTTVLWPDARTVMWQATEDRWHARAMTAEEQAAWRQRRLTLLPAHPSLGWVRWALDDDGVVWAVDAQTQRVLWGVSRGLDPWPSAARDSPPSAWTWAWREETATWQLVGVWAGHALSVSLTSMQQPRLDVASVSFPVGSVTVVHSHDRAASGFLLAGDAQAPDQMGWLTATSPWQAPVTLWPAPATAAGWSAPFRQLTDDNPRRLIGRDDAGTLWLLREVARAAWQGSSLVHIPLGPTRHQVPGVTTALGLMPAAEGMRVLAYTTNAAAESAIWVVPPPYQQAPAESSPQRLSLGRDWLPRAPVTAVGGVVWASGYRLVPNRPCAPPIAVPTWFGFRSETVAIGADMFPAPPSPQVIEATESVQGAAWPQADASGWIIDHPQQPQRIVSQPMPRRWRIQRSDSAADPARWTDENLRRAGHGGGG